MKIIAQVLTGLLLLLSLSSVQASEPTSECREGSYAYPAKVLKVIDGDTVDVRILLGMGVSLTRRVRLSGINAPETRTRDLDEKARGLLSKQWLTAMTTGNNILLRTERDKKDKWGRLLAYLYKSDSEGCHNLNLSMVKLNLAKPY